MSDPFVPPINLSIVQRPGTPGDSADATRMTNIEARLTELEARALRPIVSNFWYGPLSTLDGWSALASQTINQNRLYAAPFLCPQAATFDAFGINVTTAVAFSTIRIGVYASGADGYPAAIVAELGTVDSSATGWRSNIGTLALDPGAYWIAGACSHAGVAVSAIQALSNIGMTAYLGISNPGTNDIPGSAVDRTANLDSGFTSLPTPFGAASVIASCMAFQLQAA